MTRDDIILGALQLIAVKQSDDTTASLSIGDQAIGASKLNAILADLSIKVQPWSKRKAVMLALSADVDAINLSNVLTNYEGDLSVNFYGNTLPVTGFTATPAAGGALTAGTYYYKVNAYDGDGNVLSIGPEVPAVADAGHPTINLAWSAVSGAAYYRVFRSTLPDAQAVYNQVAGLALADNGAVVWSVGSPDPASNLPLETLPQSRWDEIANKNQKGLPECGYITPDNILRLWPFPVTAGILKLRYRAAVSATASASDIPDLPARWGLALQHALAVELVLPYVAPPAIFSTLIPLRDRLVLEQMQYDAQPAPSTFEVAD